MPEIYILSLAIAAMSSTNPYVDNTILTQNLIPLISHCVFINTKLHVIKSKST